MRRICAAMAMCLCVAGTVRAGESLSCQIEREGASGKSFAWSYAHSEAKGRNKLKTSIGTIGRAEGPGYTTALTLNGKPVALPPEYAGVIRFGKVFEQGGGVALAYMVTRQNDSEASPSELVFLLDKSGGVSQIQVQPGNSEQVAGHCYLVQ